MQYDFKLCRICAKIAKTCVSHTLFERSRKDLLRKIALVTGVSLRNCKSLPQQICEECEMDLNQSYEFRQRCINAQTYFSSTAYKKHLRSNVTSKEQTVVSEETEDNRQGNKCKQLQLNIEFETDPKIYLKREPCPEESTNAVVLLSSNNVPSHTITCDEIEISLLEQAVDNENVVEEMAGAVEIERLECPSNKRIYTKLKIENPKESEITDSEYKLENVGEKTKKMIVHKKRKHTGKNECIFICDQCGNNFKCRQHLQTHLKRHAGVKPYQCEVCPGKFFTHSELTRHMRRHTGERPFACKYCQRSFSDYSTRIKHERTHTNERPFACSQCGKAFTTSYILKNHMLVHTGERSFECTYCSRSFQRQTHLIVHNRSIMHQQNVEKAQQELNKQMKPIGGTTLRLPAIRKY